MMGELVGMVVIDDRIVIVERDNDGIPGLERLTPKLGRFQWNERGWDCRYRFQLIAPNANSVAQHHAVTRQATPRSPLMTAIGTRRQSNGGRSGS
jgi:hypothetical protein